DRDGRIGHRRLPRNVEQVLIGVNDHRSGGGERDLTNKLMVPVELRYNVVAGERDVPAGTIGLDGDGYRLRVRRKAELDQVHDTDDVVRGGVDHRHRSVVAVGDVNQVGGVGVRERSALVACSTGNPLS